MASAPLPLHTSPIRFGTDGWRGILGVDITLERLLAVAATAARELAASAPASLSSREVIVGYDRRFMAPELAEAITASVRGVDLDPLLCDTPVPTPACSGAVVQRGAIGALVITASHNPAEWLGLKIKGHFGGSVEGGFTARVERQLQAGGVSVPRPGTPRRFEAMRDYLNGLAGAVDTTSLREGLKRNGLRLIVDPMHGSAAGCLSRLLGDGGAEGMVREIHSGRDPLFGGHPPEPLAQYLPDLMGAVAESAAEGTLAMGLVFDGDGDRIAAVDERGRFCSTQLLMPLLMDHLARVRGLPGSVVKTVSGCDLMRRVGEGLGRTVLETPVGFKYIASRMLEGEVLVGGEESGGVGFGMHTPERDALFAALLIVEAVVEGGCPLGQRLDTLQAAHGGASHYDRVDLRLADMDCRTRLESLLENTPPPEVAGHPVIEVNHTDGVKLRLGSRHWLMLRFSGTEPLLRLYCEAPDRNRVQEVLSWAESLATST